MFKIQIIYLGVEHIDQKNYALTNEIFSEDILKLNCFLKTI